MNPAAGIMSWEQADQIMQDQRAEIERLRLAAAECVAEKAADWKAACESAEAASKEIGRLRLTDAEREAIDRVAFWLDQHGWRKDVDTLLALLERTK
jgi:hypothetical protein